MDSTAPVRHHRDTWLWMPTMMVVGTLMWLVMGGGP